MTAGNEPGRPAAIPDDEQALRREIEQTREQLGETVEQLVGKADVRARATQLTGRVKSAVTDAVKQRGAPLAAGASVLLGTYLLLRWWRSRD